MHRLTVQTPIQIGSIGLEPTDYLVEDINGAELLSREAGFLTHRLPDEVPINQAEDYNGKTILIVRPGGAGDCLFLSPSLRAIKQRWPQARVHVSCFDQFAQIFANNPDVDIAGLYPLKLEHWCRASAKIWLENSLEKGYAARHTPAIDLFAERIGIGPLVDKSMRYEVTHGELEAAKARFPRTNAKRIGIQVYSSARCRTYPEARTIELVKLLHKSRFAYEIVIFGAPGEVKSDDGPNFINLTTQEKPLSFRESAAVLATCQALIGPDSALIHLASAIGVPACALYGAFPWQLRTSYSPKTIALQGRCSFGACHHHARAGQVWPTGGPCQKSNTCEALEGISPERIIAKMEGML